MMINSQRCSVFCLKNIFLYHNMRQENSVSIHARTKVSSHCSIGNVVCNGHTQTLRFMFQNSIEGERGVFFSKALNFFFFFIYNRMCRNQNIIFFVASDQLCFPLRPHTSAQSYSYWLKKVHTQLQIKPTAQRSTWICLLVFLQVWGSVNPVFRPVLVVKARLLFTLFLLGLGKTSHL